MVNLGQLIRENNSKCMQIDKNQMKMSENEMCSSLFKPILQ